MNEPLPRAARPFLRFAAALRAAGFPATSDRTIGFMDAVALLGPRSIEDVRRAAHALHAPPPERRRAFDAVFDRVFLAVEARERDGSEDDVEEVRVQEEEEQGGVEPPSADRTNEAGEAAASAEALSARRFAGADERDVLRRFAKAAPAALPRRRAHRLAPARRGEGFDLRRTLRRAARSDGEPFALLARRRKTRLRAILLLVDVSGSMKARTEAHMRFAHALGRAADRLETFTFGTRLTRVTRALRRRDVDQALAAAAATVSDWDGGTRIGDALGAFLAVPRFAAFARGAVVLILSDGLERGDPAAMIRAVERLSRRAWRLAWLTPLAADPRYRPETRAMAGILPFVDAIADGSTTERLCAVALGLAREAA